MLPKSKLPVDILAKIAFAIPDAEDVFAFLEALYPYDLLGPLECLYQLWLECDQSDLWPSLCLKPWTLESELCSAYEAIAKYYSIVELDDFYNVEWLKKYVNPMAQIEWRINHFPVAMEIVDAWSDLTITWLYVDLMGGSNFPWKELLQRLPHLTSLEVRDDFVDLSDLYEFVATSKQITQLQIIPSNEPMKDSHVACLTQWLRHQPVELFACTSGQFSALQSHAKQAFYQAMFNCPTLVKLELTICDLNDVDFAKMTLVMKTLSLTYCLSNARAIESLAKGLEGSKIEYLLLTDDFDSKIHIVEALMRVLPYTSIKYLALSGAHFTPPQLARRLAITIQSNHTIRELVLNETNVSFTDLGLLIQGITYPGRRAKTTTIKWTSPVELVVNSRSVESLVEFAFQRGCQFVHEAADPCLQE
ncbi:hypothetical protein AeNC1_011623 [Aphanomyces euteiches]|nr:hypothetical protein AeNC1_011623 [Aphanomyces euteiches]